LNAFALVRRQDDFNEKLIRKTVAFATAGLVRALRPTRRRYGKYRRFY
jgi:hypothetical protein